MSERHTASCSCGQTSIICRGEPRLVSICHCNACKKRTGSAFGIAVFFDSCLTEATGDIATFTRKSDSGHEVNFRFCPTCGTTLFWSTTKKPKWVAVAAGCFDNPLAIAPDQEVFKEQRCPWLGNFALPGK